MNNHALSQLLKSIAIGLLAMAWLPLHAQLSYVFTAQSGTYSEVSGGTDLNTIEADDVHSAAINLGFTFNFDGTNLTQVRVNSNGWLSLATGDSPSAAQGRDNSVMASANGNTRPALMPLWDDLSGTGGVAVYRTTGSSPNRVFTMEWRNWRWNYNAGGAVISFQVKLYEGSNVIEYIYRQQGTAYTGTGSTGGASIGMIASGGAYISLNGTGTNPGTSTSVATTNLTTKPANGQIYRFTPCTSPTAAYGAGITDCVSGTYTIPVNVTSLGSSASVNIVASPGGTVHSGVGIGSHIIGPLPLGTNVTVNVVGSAGCSTALAATTMNDVDATCHAASVYPIPDNGCGSNNYRDIPFCLNSTGTQLGTDVFVRSVDLIASSTYNADLELRLISPNGTTVLLVNDRFGNGDNLGNPSNCPNSLFTLRDGGTPLVSSNQSNVTGEYAPEQPLSGFHDGSDPNGTWTLRACDHYAQDLSAMRYVRVNLCSPATATVNAVPNCANGQFNVAVNVTNFGSGTSARLTYAMNGGTPIVMNGVGLGTTNLGPFPADAAVHVTVSNGLSDCGMITRSVYSNCPVTLDCGTTATVDHCYGNNDGRTFTYLSPFHGETVTINFIQGALDLNDALLVFDGADDTAPLIDGGSFYGSLGGMSFTSSGPAIHMKILANGANSCADGGQAVPWSFEAKCTPGCQAPAAFVDIFNDCGSYTFSAELMVMYAGDGASNDVVYTVNGGAPNRISGVPEWESVPFGPFTIGDEVQITVEHETDRLCDLNLGTFTNTVQCPSAENCLNTLNLATQSSPLSGTTIGRVNDFSIACAPATANTARDAIYFIDVPRYQQLRIRQQSNNYDSQHYVRYGGACPGTTAIACVDDADSEIGWVNWVNTTGGTQRVWWIQDGYGSNAGNFVLEWDLVGCPATTAAAATTILSNSAYANFTYLTGDYVIEYGPSATFTTPGTAALPGPNGTVITAGASPFQITGLAPNTAYRYFVRRSCGGGVYSANSNAITFTTAAGTAVTNGQCGYNLAIPNNGCGSSNFLNALVTISGQNDQLNTNVALESVDLIITHPNRADIDMVLISPTGQSRNLMLDRGGSGDNFGNNGNCPTAVFKLRDGGTALNTIGNTPNSVTGTYAPEQALAGFTGNPNGTWTVRICDDASWNAGNLRYVRLNFQVIDCLGVPGGSALPGTPCNDGNACTINDTYTVDCQCVGTFQDTDNDGVCNANDGCPNDPAKIAPGVCGCGTPDVPVTYYADSDGDGVGDPLVSQPGYTCNVPPGYVTTTGDGCPTDANKTHPGVCGCGTPDTDTDEDGTADCIDGCPNDPDKTAPGVCGCGTADIAVTYYADADGDGAGDPLVSQPGYTCNVPPGYVTNADDGCPGDANKTAPGVCGCGNLDTDTDNDGTPDCDDDCPADPDKTSPGECGCGVPDTDTDDDGVADCNDGCPTDPDKTAPGACGCGNPDTDSDGDGVLDCNDSCPNLFGGVGSPCNDNNSGTVLDQITPGCQCQGVPCTEQVNLAIDLDMHGSQISWEIAQSGTGIVICSGGLEIPYPDNTPFPLVESCCLPAGCYSLTVFDSAGDGITGGGYQLRETGANGRRIIDNTGGFTTGFQSSLAGDQDFCVPIGDDRLIFSSCDKLDWVANKYVVAVANPAVSATWVQGGPNSAQPTNSGYEFWIFDPNGGYSFRRFRSHSVSDGFSPANAYRACHMKLNGWMDSHITPHVPEGTLMNVKVRGRVNGVNLPFGHACKLKLDAVLATCPRVKLQDDPSNPDDYSCGVFRSFGGGSNPANRITANPPQPVPVVASNNVRYQFRFRIQGEGVCIVRPPQTSARMQLNWNATSGAPLVCNKTYDVDVRVSLDGGATWCFGPAGSGQAAACADSDAWGKVCKVTINGCSQANGGGSNMAQNADGTSPHQRVLLYPNPNRGEQLFISLPSPSGAAEAARTVSVDIFDMTGKRVAARTLTVQHGMVNSTMDLNGDLPGGVYLVNITTDDKTYTERLVIQR